MEVSLFYDGGHYYKGDIIRIFAWYGGNRTECIGRIAIIDGESLLLDFSDVYKAKKRTIMFDEIISLELIQGRL